MKTDVRLIRAEDVIWMILDDEHRNMDFADTRLDEHGFQVELPLGDKRPGYVSVVAMGWNSVAMALGHEACEYCLNPDGHPYVLLYNMGEA